MKALKGDIVYSTGLRNLVTKENSYLVYERENIVGVFEKLSNFDEDIEVEDYTGCLIMPGLYDLHVHAPQYAYRGLGMDLELLDWLNNHTFPEEIKYSDLEYAMNAYSIFVDDLINGATVRACIFATIHTEATILLMKMLEDRGFRGYVGKVSMNRNAPQLLCESNAVDEIVSWLNQTETLKGNISPILTPRFIPSCTDNLLVDIAQIQKATRLPLQSHLSESLSEVNWIKELVKDSDFYGDAYYKYGLFGQYGKTVMAHCVYSSDEEIELLKKMGVYVAHCPSSNSNLSSGIAPVRKFIQYGVNVGIGTDVAGGESISMFRAMAETIKDSKLRWRLKDEELSPLTFEEVFYMATKAGGSFFGKTGSFEDGYYMDALVLEDSELRCPYKLNIRERIERFTYLGDDRFIKAKYIAGNRIERRK